MNTFFIVDICLWEERIPSNTTPCTYSQGDKTPFLNSHMFFFLFLPVTEFSSLAQGSLFLTASFQILRLTCENNAGYCSYDTTH